MHGFYWEIPPGNKSDTARTSDATTARTTEISKKTFRRIFGFHRYRMFPRVAGGDFRPEIVIRIAAPCSTIPTPGTRIRVRSRVPLRRHL